MKAKEQKYGRAWKRIRDKYISEHPSCELCGREAQEVHHITPICEGGGHNKSNLMSLCSECHTAIHLTHNEQAVKLYKHEKVLEVLFDDAKRC